MLCYVIYRLISNIAMLQVACGNAHMVAVSSSGRLYGWGTSIYGELLRVEKGVVNYAIKLNLGE